MCHLNKAKTDHHRILWSLQNTVTLVKVFWTTNSYFLTTWPMVWVMNLATISAACDSLSALTQNAASTAANLWSGCHLPLFAHRRKWSGSDSHGLRGIQPPAGMTANYSEAKTNSNNNLVNEQTEMRMGELQGWDCGYYGTERIHTFLNECILF